MAHCLGHHLIHVGAQQAWTAKQERQADEFAAWLTVPASDAVLYMNRAELAQKYRVTEALAKIRME